METNSGLLVLMMCQLFIVTNVPLQWGMLMVGQAVCGGGGQGVYRNSLSFLLNFVVNQTALKNNIYF